MPTGIANCPLDRVLTYKNLIYLLNLQILSTHEKSDSESQQQCQFKDNDVCLMNASLAFNSVFSIYDFLDACY